MYFCMLMYLLSFLCCPVAHSFLCFLLSFTLTGFLLVHSLSSIVSPPSLPPTSVSSLNSDLHPIYLRKKAASAGKTAGLGGEIWQNATASPQMPRGDSCCKGSEEKRGRCSVADRQIWTGQPHERGSMDREHLQKETGGGGIKQCADIHLCEPCPAVKAS